MAVLVAAQLFSIASHEQQGIVGAGADHQDAHDRLALGVDREVGVLGQQVDHAGRRHEGEDSAEDRQDPEERAAVGEQQDHDHHEEGGHDEVGVDALERLGGVGGLTAVARQVDRDAVDLGDLTHVLGRGWDVVPAVLAEVEGEVEVADLAVVGDELDGDVLLLRDVGGEHALVGHAVDLGDLGGLLVHRREVVVGQAGGAVVDDQGGDRVGVDRAGELVEHLGRLGARGEPGGRLVVLDVGQLGGQAGGDAEDDDPRDEDDPLGDSAGQLAGNLTMHALTPSRGGDRVHPVIP